MWYRPVYTLEADQRRRASFACLVLKLEHLSRYALNELFEETQIDLECSRFGMEGSKSGLDLDR